MSLDLLNNKAATSAWRNLNGGGVSSKQTFKYGDRIYVVAIAGSSSGMCPIANFTCQLFNQYPMTTDELKTAGQNTRLNSYLDDHYRSVNTVSFDNDDDEQTLLAPTSPDDNQDRLPSKWSRRSYGFVYRELMNSAPAGNMYVNPKHSPLHGDYGLYKSANVKGKSGDGLTGTDGYLWWPSVQLYDRTYANTNGAQYGHFLYIDASDESRQIAEADFSADLCVGSQVIFSAAIADMTTGAQRPQLLFKLYGVNYDANNQETERRLLHSFSSGNFSGNRVGYDAGNIDDNERNYSRIKFEAKPRFLWRVFENAYVGPVANFQYVKMTDLNDDVIGLVGSAEKNFMAVGAGVSLNYDSRDVVTNASRGWLFQLDQLFMPAFDRPVGEEDLIDGKYLLVQRGKKNYYLITVK